MQNPDFKKPSPALVGSAFTGMAALALFALARARSHAPASDKEYWNWLAHGPLYSLLAHQALLLKALSGVLGILAVGMLLLRPATNRLWSGFVARLENRSGANAKSILGLNTLVFWTLVVGVLVHLPSIPFGGFFNDDFGIIRVDRTLPLFQALTRYHNDHALPGYRLEVRILDSLFGVSAPGWNIALLAVYAATLWLLALVMKRFGVRPLPAAVALLVFIISRTSSSLLQGYYCVSTTMQSTATCFAAFLAFDYSVRANKKSWGMAGLAIMVAGALVDISGIWILAGVPVLLFAASEFGISVSGLFQWIGARKRLLFELFLGGVIVVGCYGWMSLSDHPRLTGGAHSYENWKPLTPAGVVSQLFYYFSSGVFLQLVLPVGGEHGAKFYALALLAVTAILGLSFRFGSTSERRLLLASSLLIFLFALEVAVGRPLSTTNSFWCQHVATAHLLAMLVVGAGLTAAERVTGATPWKISGIAAIVGFCGLLMATSGAPSAIFYVTKLLGLQRIRADIHEVGQRLETLVTKGQGIQALPVLEAAYIRANFHEPRPDNDLYDYQYFLPAKVQAVPFVRTPAMNTLNAYDGVPPANVELVDSLRARCGPSFAQTLAQTPEALWLYSPALHLDQKAASGPATGTKVDAQNRLQDATAVTTDADQSVSFHSDGKTELPLAEGSFDPEARSVLIFGGSVEGGKPVQVQIICQGTPFEKIEGWFTVNPTFKEDTRIDLKRLPIFALSSQITDIRLRFVTPGQYHIKSCQF